MTFTRAIEFSAAFRYADSHLSENENRDFYGSSYDVRGFGETFRLEASFSGSIDPSTGMIINLVDIDRWLAGLRVRLHDSMLNNLHDIFAGHAPTLERLALYCHQYLVECVNKEGPLGSKIEGIRLWEGESLYVEVD